MTGPWDSRRSPGRRSVVLSLGLLVGAILLLTLFAGSAAATDGEASLTVTDNSTGAETVHTWQTTIGQSPTLEPRPMEQIALNYGDGVVNVSGVTSQDVDVSLGGTSVSTGTVDTISNTLTVDTDGNVTAAQGETLSVTIDGIRNPTTAGTYNATLAISGGDAAYDPATTTYSVGSGADSLDIGIDQNASTLHVQEGEQVDVVVDLDPLDPLGLLDVELLTNGELRATDSVSLDLLQPTSLTLSFEARAVDDGATITVNAGGEIVTTTLTVDTNPLLDVSIDDIDDTVTTEENLTVSYSVENLGDLTGVQDLTMLVDGEPAAVEEGLQLDGGLVQNGSFTYSPAQSDVPSIDVVLQTLNSTVTRTVQVVEPSLFEVSIDESASTLHVTEGERVEVVANVSNLGGIVDTRQLSLLVDDAILNSTSVQVASGAAETVTLSFEASAALDGSTISLQTLDDVATATISVDVPALFEVDIDEAASTLNVTAGNQVAVVANVTNVGGLLATQTVSLVRGDVTTDSRAVQLAGGESRTVQFTFEANASDDGAVLALSTLDDVATTTLSVGLPALFEVSIDESASTLHVAEGEQVDVVANVTNVGGLPGTGNLSLLVGGSAHGSQSVELGSGVSQTVTFSFEATAAHDGAILSLETLDDAANATLSVDSPGVLELGLNQSASRLDVAPGETAEVALDYENVGDLAAVEEISLFVGGQVRTVETVEAAGGASGQVTLSFVAQASDDGAALTASSASDFVTATLSVSEDQEPEPDPEPVGSVAFDGQVLATQTQFGVHVAFDGTLGEDAFLTVSNQRTEGTVSQHVSADGTVQVAATDLGGIQTGDSLSAALYETNDRVTLLDEATRAVQSPPDPAIEVPSTLEFGTVTVGTTGQATVTLQNTGTAPLSIAEVAVDDAAFAVTDAPTLVEPGSQAAVAVTLAPTSPGPVEATLTILSNASVELSTVSLTGFGQEIPEPAGELSLSTGSLSFGPVGIGEATAAELTVTNTGDGSLTVDPVTVGGQDAGAFSVQTGLLGPGMGSVVLSAGQSTTIRVTFAPSAPAQHRGSLAVETSAGEQSVSLRGQGIEPTADIDPETVDFGQQTIGASVTQTVTLTAGATAVEVDSLTIAGPAASEFDLGETPETIPAGGTASVDVTYSPDVTGSHSATLELTDVTGAVDLSAALDGAAVTGPPSLQVDPTSVRFENTTVGDTVTETVTLTNDGGSTLTLTRAELGASGAFELSAGEIPPGEDAVTLAPGNSRTVTVEFSPQTTGGQQTYLYVVSDAPERPNRVVAVTSGAVESAVTVDERNRQRLEAVFENVSAGEEIDLPFPEPLGEENYETDNVTVRPSVSGDLRVNVTSSQWTLPTTPNTMAGFANNTTMVGNISAETNLPNSQIAEVTFEATLDRAQLEAWGTDAGNVSFYRFEEGERVWQKHDTEVIRETETEVTLLVRADGFSEWTAAAARPEFAISDTNIDVDTETTPEEVTIQVYVSNTGGTDGRYVADLLLNGDIVDSQGAIIADGGLELFQFERMLDEPGTYEIRVNDVYVANVDVSDDSAEVSDPDSQAGDDGEGGDEESDVSLSFALPAVGIALLLAAALGVWGYRRRQA